MYQGEVQVGSAYSQFSKKYDSDWKFSGGPGAHRVLPPNSRDPTDQGSSGPSSQRTMPKNFLCKSPKSFLQKWSSSSSSDLTPCHAGPAGQRGGLQPVAEASSPLHRTQLFTSPMQATVFLYEVSFRSFTSMSYLSCAGNPPLKERDTTGNESESLGCGQQARNLSRRTSTRVGSCRTGTTRACSARPWRSGSRRGRSGRTARATQPAANERAAPTRWSRTWTAGTRWTHLPTRSSLPAWRRSTGKPASLRSSTLAEVTMSHLHILQLHRVPQQHILGFKAMPPIQQVSILYLKPLHFEERERIK